LTVRGTALGQYLRARRQLVHPDDVNLATIGRRRVPGLRREELARLAGISTESDFSAASTPDVIAGVDLSGRIAIVTGGYSGIGRKPPERGDPR
jgi:hypothetical protein